MGLFGCKRFFFLNPCEQEICKKFHSKLIWRKYMWISVKGRHLPFNSISQGTFWSILRNEKEIKDWYRSWLKEIQLWSKCFTWHHYRRNQHLWYYASSRAKEAWHRRSYTLVFYLYSAQSGTTHTLNSSPSSSWKQISNTNSLQPSIWREILHPASLEGCDPITEVYNKSHQQSCWGLSRKPQTWPKKVLENQSS